MESPGHKPLVVNRVVVGPFKEEDEGTSVTIVVVKVKTGVKIHPPQVPFIGMTPGQ